jgi:hypothetical protein
MALSTDTPRVCFAPSHPDYPIKAAANQVFKKGSIVAVNTSDGFAYVGAVGTTLKVVGVAAYALNTTGLASGDRQVVVTPGTIGFFTSGTSGDLIEENDRLLTCYLIDDDTVGLTNGGSTRSVAGKIFDVTSEGVVVQFEEVRL